MKKLLLVSTFLISQLFFAQVTGEDVKFFLGEGSQTAYLVIDFKDGTDDRSYVWGFRYEEDDLTFGSILLALEEAEPNFSHTTAYGGAFLNDVIFNSHSGLDSNPDWWSVWSGDASDSMEMNSGISEGLEDGRWYGLSYGFSNPSAEHPVQPIPAYHSLWFSADDMTTWFGEGENQSIVVLDFGTDTEGEADSFAFGIRYQEETISAESALELLQASVVDFSYELNGNEMVEISWNSHQGIATEENPWKSYTGTDLSNWVTTTELSEINLENGQWLGFSFGERRPYIPTDQATQMGVQEVFANKFSLYPNPASSVFYVNSSEVSKVEIYDVSGRLVKSAQNSPQGIRVNELAQGIYIVKLYSTTSVQTQKLLVR